jgi:hypothetical protein
LASAGPGKDLKREKNRFQIRLVIKSKPVTARPLAHRLEKIETSSGMIGWAQIAYKVRAGGVTISKSGCKPDNVVDVKHN